MTTPDDFGGGHRAASGAPAASTSTSTSDMPETGEARWQPLLIGADPLPAVALESCLPTGDNPFLWDGAKRICDHRGATLPSPLYIHGNPGVGKSHLMCAIAGACGEAALYMHTADLEAEVARARRTGFLAECYFWIFSHRVVLIDDIQYAVDNDALQTALSHLMEQLLQRRRTVVISASKRPEHLGVTNSHLVSILLGGIVSKMAICGEETRLAVLRQRFDSRVLPDKVALYLARNVKDNLRRLISAADQLVALSRQTGTETTVDMARAVVPLPEDLRHRSTPPPPPPGGESKPDEPGAKEARVSFFKEMMDAAENEAEQVLALQIALGQRLREMRAANGDPETIERFERALALLRDGKLAEALEHTAASVKQ